MGSLTQTKSCPDAILSSDDKFAPGQVWMFKGRSFEPAARLTILRIDLIPKIGKVIHVRLDGIRLRNCSGGPEPNSIQHAPFTKEALERSSLKLLNQGEVPDYQEGYDRWRHDCGGVYSISVSQMVVADETTFNAGSNCTTNLQ